MYAASFEAGHVEQIFDQAIQLARLVCGGIQQFDASRRIEFL